MFARIKLWLAGAGAAALGVLAALVYGWRRGAKGQARKDAQARAADDVDAAEQARDTYMDADQAAKDVKRKAQTEPAPDVNRRDDFDNTF